MNRTPATAALFPADPETFLNRVYLSFRGGLKHSALTIVRGGTADPETIETALRARMEKNGSSLAYQALRQMNEHPEELRSWIESLSAHDREMQELPWDVRQLQKRAKAEHHFREWAAKRPPSDRQVWKLRQLGWRHSPPRTMAECAELIDELREGESR